MMTERGIKSTGTGKETIPEFEAFVPNERGQKKVLPLLRQINGLNSGSVDNFLPKLPQNDQTTAYQEIPIITSRLGEYLTKETLTNSDVRHIYRDINKRNEQMKTIAQLGLMRNDGTIVIYPLHTPAAPSTSQNAHR